MAKLILTMNDFSGGQNTTTAPRDLLPNEMQLCENMDPNNTGRIHTGRVLDNAITATGSTPTQAGYGLVIWSNDYQLDASATEGFTGQFIGRQNGTNLDVLESTDGLTGTARNNIMTGLPTSPAYYAAEGDLYVGGHSAGTFVAPKSLVLHRREDFPGTTIARSVKDWKESTQAKTAPVAGVAEMAALWGYYATDGDADPIQSAATQAADSLWWVIIFGDEASGGWVNDADKGTEDYIELAGTWMYKNGSESDLTNLGLGNFTGRDLDGAAGITSEDADDRPIRVQAWIKSVGAGTTDKAARSGARLYAKYKNKNTWFLLSEVDFEKGIIGDLEFEWSEWKTASSATDPAPFNNGGNDPAIIATHGWIKNPPEALTFESMNQYRASEIPTSNLCYFKTGCVANGRAYVGNVKINNRVYSDRILKSPLYQYDVFTEDIIVDVALGDGDEIVKLVSYADRILIFKHNDVIILNVSQEMEQVESQVPGVGIDNPGAVTETPFGISWVNRNGAYVFNGETIKSINQRDEGQE